MSFFFTCMLLNGIPLNHQNLVLLFNFRINTIFHKSNQSSFIENGFYPSHFQSPNILKLVIHIYIRSYFSSFGIKNMDILNNNGVKVLKSFKHFRNCVAILRQNSCQLMICNRFLCSPLWLDSCTSKETNSLGVKVSLGIQPPKKYLNLKLFEICNFEWLKFETK
jgi:hypothetical protein